MAGTWETVASTTGSLAGKMSSIYCLSAQFTADAADASVPVLTVGDTKISALLQRVSITFGDPAPSGAAFTVKITDQDGVTVGNPEGTAITETSNITCNHSFVGPLYVNITGNETNSATAKVSLYVINC